MGAALLLFPSLEVKKGTYESEHAGDSLKKIGRRRPKSLKNL
jgi:hypothetical protein